MFASVVDHKTMCLVSSGLFSVVLDGAALVAVATAVVGEALQELEAWIFLEPFTLLLVGRAQRHLDALVRDGGQLLWLRQW